MKKLLSIVLVVLLFLMVVAPISAYAFPTREPVTVCFHRSTGTLEVLGQGVASEIRPLEVWEYGIVSATTDNSDVKHIIIGEGITAIDNCFNFLENLETVQFPESLTTISRCFYDCDKLTKLDFPEKLKIVANMSFNDCDGIKELHFKSPVSIVFTKDWPQINEAEYGAVFSNLDNLKTIDLKPNSTIIGAFAGCLGLDEVEIPRGCVVGDSFSDCLNLHKVTFGSNARIKFFQYYKEYKEFDILYSTFYNCRKDLTIHLNGISVNNIVFSAIQSFDVKFTPVAVVRYVLIILVIITTVAILIVFKKR